MKLTCPKCHSQNLASPAVGIFRCADCTQYFDASFQEMAGADHPPLLRVNNLHHSVYADRGGRRSSGGGAGMIIWPLVLVALLVVTFLGIIPLLFGVIFIFMAILGAIVSQLSQRNK